MAMKMVYQNIGGKSEILATGDHYVSLGHKAARATSVAPGQTVLINGRYILRVGTIWSVSGKAVGLVADDYDLTDGDAQIAVIVHNVINRSKLPVAPTFAQEKEMHGILFVDGSEPVALVSDYPEYFLVTVPSVEHGSIAIEEGSHRVVVKGGAFEFKVTAGEGYHVSAVTANGDAVTPSTAGVYSIEDIDEDVAIAVTIEADSP